MARRIVGITVSSQNVSMPVLGPVGCVTDPDDCCVTTWNCTPQGCVEVAGPNGQYPTSDQCNQNCDGPIQTTCCPDDPLPLVLYLAVTAGWPEYFATTGFNLGCANPVPLYANPAIPGHYQSGFPACAYGNVSFFLTCDSGVWHLRMQSQYPCFVPTAGAATADSVTCNPYCAIFTFPTHTPTLDDLPCGVSVAGTISVSADPSGVCGGAGYSYDCVEGWGCKSVVGTGGTFPDLATCNEACPPTFGCDQYSITGLSPALSRTVPFQWGDGFYTLFNSSPTYPMNWGILNSITGHRWAATGWDGTGCKIFTHQNDGDNDIEVCCVGTPGSSCENPITTQPGSSTITPSISLWYYLGTATMGQVATFDVSVTSWAPGGNCEYKLTLYDGTCEALIQIDTSTNIGSDTTGFVSATVGVTGGVWVKAEVTDGTNTINYDYSWTIT